MGDELFPRKDGKIVTSDVDYVDSRLDCCTFTCRPQVELHPYLIQTDMIEFCKSKNIALTAYSPFGSPGRPSELGRALWLTRCTIVWYKLLLHKRPQFNFIQEYSVSIFRASLSVSLQIFDFSLTEEDMSALKGLNRGWKACAIEE
uniref:Zgc:56622 n=1 Tax=Neolamprologus brichardi TaxID=32507 RepID=A0A3Q4HM94_NEOBR